MFVTRKIVEKSFLNLNDLAMACLEAKVVVQLTGLLNIQEN